MRLPRPDKSSSSVQGHRPLSDFHERSFLERNSGRKDWWPALLPAGSSSDVCSYPMPTHSMHRLIPLERTVSPSPRHRPIKIISRATANIQIVFLRISISRETPQRGLPLLFLNFSASHLQYPQMFPHQRPNPLCSMQNTRKKYRSRSHTKMRY